MPKERYVGGASGWGHRYYDYITCNIYGGAEVALLISYIVSLETMERKQP